MKAKNIKRIVTKQLKNKFPNWKSLTRKEKKAIAKEVTLAVVEDYDNSEESEIPLKELVGIQNQTDKEGILSLKEMETLIEDFHKNKLIAPAKIRKFRANIKTPLIKYIDDILEDEIINDILWYKGYTPSKRLFTPAQFFRAELLKAIKYPEIAYRKYCAEEYMGMERKENKEFLGLPLHKKMMIDHTQLCTFRKSLSFSQTTNLLVYVLHHVKQSGILDNCHIHGVDSTELYNEEKFPLFTVKIGGKKVRIYSDLDCDCGTRRAKRSKSKFFIGYRMHTLTAIDSETGHNFPIASIFSAGNHHDSHFLHPLIELAQAMGVEMKLITADEAYHDEDGEIPTKTKVEVITPPTGSVKLPENVDPQTYTVTHSEECEIPMEHLGCFEGTHEFRCSAQAGECFHSDRCSKNRMIPVDKGVFQSNLVNGDLAQKSIEIRKHVERPFNLLKHCHGLERLRVRSQEGLIVTGTFATIACLFVAMERKCNDRKKNPLQMSIFDAAS